MGAEFLPKSSENDLSGDYQAAPVILGLLPAALVDHIARVDLSILSRIPGNHSNRWVEIGGRLQVGGNRSRCCGGREGCERGAASNVLKADGVEGGVAGRWFVE